MNNKTQVSAVTPRDESCPSNLEDFGLFREFQGRWQYRQQPFGAWMTANSKAGAQEMAQAACDAMPKESRKTKAQRDRDADAQHDSENENRYGGMNDFQLSIELLRLNRLIAEHQKAGEREMNGNGGRRTAGAVSAESARQHGEEKLRLQGYMSRRKELWRGADSEVAA